MTHLGDITKIDWFHVPPVDVVTGGSPCQDLSVAGKRAGLAGERSGLYMEQIRCVKELRKTDEQRGRTGVAVRPRYMVWENVPGAFSSNGGEDFRAVLEEAAKIAQPDAVIPRPPKGKWTNSGAIMGDGWSIAWRVHDAQFWGVPQRRRRISVVCDFGGLSAPEILFERKGLSGDFDESGAPGKETAGGAGDGTEGASGAYNPWDSQSARVYSQDGVWHSLNANENGGQSRDSVLAISFQERAGKPGGGKGILIQNERTGALSTLNNQSVFCLQGNGIDRADTAECNGKGWRKDVSYTLNTIDRPAVAFAQNQRNEVRDLGDIAGALAAEPGMKQQTFVYDARGNGERQGIERDAVVQTYAIQRNDEYKESDLAHTQAARDYKSATDLVVSANGQRQSVYGHSIVRRLTPLEAERLQGYPGGWTDIGEWVDSKGKRHKDADSPRYKALGNSIALPFWFWLLRRISAQYIGPATLGSLFDGISGFCYVWARCNGSKSCLWASEIEEFPIAVCKRHFGDEESGEVGDILEYL